VREQCLPRHPRCTPAHAADATRDLNRLSFDALRSSLHATNSRVQARNHTHHTSHVTHQARTTPSHTGPADLQLLQQQQQQQAALHARAQGEQWVGAAAGSVGMQGILPPPQQQQQQQDITWGATVLPGGGMHHLHQDLQQQQQQQQQSLLLGQSLGLLPAQQRQQQQLGLMSTGLGGSSYPLQGAGGGGAAAAAGGAAGSVSLPLAGLAMDQMRPAGPPVAAGGCGCECASKCLL